MATAPKEYRRLPGRGSRLDGGALISVSRSRCTLWLAGDHILLVDRVGYTETYKRFYFRDIQAIIIRKTTGGFVGSLILGIFAALFLLFALVPTSPAARLTLGIIAALFIFFTLYNMWLGATCVTQIKTAVQTESLPPWKRLRATRKGMARLRPLLLQAQGEMAPDVLRAQLEERYLQQSSPGAQTFP